MFSIVPVSVTSNQSQCSHPTCHRAPASSWSWPPWPPPPWRGSGAPWASGPALPPVLRWDRPVASVTRRETASAVRSPSGQRITIKWHYLLCSIKIKSNFYKLFSLSNLKNLLPSRCDLGEAFCEATCNSIGRSGGKCIENGNNCKYYDDNRNDDDINANFGRWMWWHIFVPIRVCPVCSGEHL